MAVAPGVAWVRDPSDRKRDVFFGARSDNHANPVAAENVGLAWGRCSAALSDEVSPLSDLAGGRLESLPLRHRYVKFTLRDKRAAAQQVRIREQPSDDA